MIVDLYEDENDYPEGLKNASIGVNREKDRLNDEKFRFELYDWRLNKKASMVLNKCEDRLCILEPASFTAKEIEEMFGDDDENE